MRENGPGVVDRRAERIACGFAALLLGMPSLFAAQAGDRGIGIPREVHRVRDFDPEESCGVFVGVAEFQDEGLTTVPFGVDDAVDLAHLFCLELELIRPEGVVLVLSGEPRKTESSEHLRNLLAAGAARHPATQSTIYRVIGRDQPHAPGSKGLFVVSVATHGFNDRGIDFLVASDSIHRRIRRTGISLAEIFEDVSSADASRAIVLVDACRERLLDSVRSTETGDDLTLNVAFAAAMAEAEGLVILSATTQGGYSYEDPARGNGVFTAAILDGLRGAATPDANGFITARELADHVHQTVLGWVGDHRPEHATRSRGIAVQMEGAAGTMPLAVHPTARTRSLSFDAERTRLLPVLRKHIDASYITSTTFAEVTIALRVDRGEPSHALLERMERLEGLGSGYSEDFALWWDQRGRELLAHDNGGGSVAGEDSWEQTLASGMQRESEYEAGREDMDPEVGSRATALGADIEQLLLLARELDSTGRAAQADAVSRHVLKLDDQSEEAHLRLRHHYFDDRWFDTFQALTVYRNTEAERMLLEQGLVRFEDRWVAQSDVVWLRMGWAQGDNGTWIRPSDFERRALEATYVKEGRQQCKEDSQWIHPDDLGKRREGRFLCDDRWCSLEEADEYHSNIGQGWKWIGEHFVCDSTLDYDSTRWASYWADQLRPDLVRAVGILPERKPRFSVLNSIEQYNRVAGGDAALGLPPAEATGWSGLHYAFFAEAWFDLSHQPPEFRGTGVCFWDQGDEALSGYGRMAVSHAAALAYLEAIDPSWNFVSGVIDGTVTADSMVAYWEEKKIPRWLRYGIAAYCERFAPERTTSGSDRWATRAWALENIHATGEVFPLERVIAFDLSPRDAFVAGRLIQETGLVVSFILDGKCPPVLQQHARFKAALRRGEETHEAAAGLERALLDNEAAYVRYAGF